MNSTQQTVVSKKVEHYHDLIAWQRANSFAQIVYQVSHDFPKSEIFGITSQLRRSALSVPTNIVEGFARHNRNEFRHFLLISFASLSEAGYLLEFSLNQKYLSKERYSHVNTLREECSRLIWSLYKSQRNY